MNTLFCIKKNSINTDMVNIKYSHGQMFVYTHHGHDRLNF